MPDISPVRGLIELTDNYTSGLGLADAALSNFTKNNQASLKAVAGAAGLITVAIGGITAAAIELGRRGSEVNDVNETLQHFTGSAKAAQETMAALRDGTKGTVDNFSLAKDASLLLSAGVKLNTSDFQTLADAAFVLKSRGLGPAKDQLDLVSEALVTGRTRTLAMKLGVVDAGDAQEVYAKQLHVTVDQLSDAGKAEANRIAVLKILKAAVKDAGDQERSFGDEFAASRVKLQNWTDDLASSVASSKVFAAGFKAAEVAVTSAFGSDSQQSIKKVTSFLEQGAIEIIDFGQGAITMARVVEGAFGVVKTVILGTLTTASVVADGLVETLTAVATASAKLSHPFTDANQDPLVVYLTTTRTELRGMTADLAAQTVEAGKTVVGHTALDKTLDVLSNSLSTVQRAMIAASQATTDGNNSSAIAANNAKKLTETQKQLSQSMIDQEKVQAALKKSTAELASIYADYYKQVAEDSGTTLDAQKADVEAWFLSQVKSLDELDPLFKKKYDGYRLIADEKLKAIGSDWDSVRDQSIQGMQQMADKALQTYSDMMTNGQLFTRGALDAQLQKYKDLQAAANGWSTTAGNAVTQVTGTVKILDSAWDAVGTAVDDNNVKVKMLDGEVVSVSEALQRLNAGNSKDVTFQNFSEALAGVATKTTGGTGGLSVEHGLAGSSTAYDLAKKGYSFAEIVNALVNGQPLPLTPIGPRIPGFEQGGVVMVGERGPEPVRLPFGSQVYPTGTPTSGLGGGTHVSVTIPVSGVMDPRTANTLAEAVSQKLSQSLGMALLR